MSIEFTYEHYLKCIKPGDTSLPYASREVYQHYLQKYNICKTQNPNSILEIGVRFGYSAYAFLSACPAAVYTGLDIPDGQHGGVGYGTFDYVAKMLPLASWASGVSFILHRTKSSQAITTT